MSDVVIILEESVPVLPVSVIEPIWDQFAVLVPEHRVVDPSHPLGCHRRRIPDRVIFDHVIAALVLAQYDRMIGLQVEDVVVDGCITKAPSGGACAGRSPVDRGKHGLKRSVLVDGTGVPLEVVAAGANRHDSPLLAATLAGLDAWGAAPAATTVHLDRGYDSGATRALLDELGVAGEIACNGLPAPIQVGKRWVVERTHAWMNGYGKLRRCTEKTKAVVELYLFLAAAIVVTRCLIQRARNRYRWPNRPTTRRLK